jgi:hypothetical protein
MSEYIKVNGTWHLVGDLTTTTAQVKIKASGTWRNVIAKYIKVNGAWKEVYQYNGYQVANLVGLASGAAQTSITASGNIVGSISTTSSGATSANNGQVSAQSVSAGGYVSPQTVNLTVYYYVAPIISIIATPAQQDTFTGFSPATIYPGTTVTLTGSFPASITNIAINGVNQAFSGTSFTAPSSPGSYSVTVYDGEVPVMGSLTLTVSSVPIIIATVNFIGIQQINFIQQIATVNFIGINFTIAIAQIAFGHFYSPYYGVGVNCIHGSTRMRVYDGDKITTKAARDVEPGDQIVGAVFKELEMSMTDKFQVYDWTASSLTYDTIEKTTVTKVEPSAHTRFMYFNDDKDSLFTISEPILIEREGRYEFFATGMVLEGDTLFKMSEDCSTVSPVKVEKITFVEEDNDGYNFHCEPDHIIVAGDYIVHNK